MKHDRNLSKTITQGNSALRSPQHKAGKPMIMQTNVLIPFRGPAKILLISNYFGRPKGVPQEQYIYLHNQSQFFSPAVSFWLPFLRSKMEELRVKIHTLKLEVQPL